jgi:RHS repeat-associated protein
VVSRHDFLPFGEEIAAGSAGRTNVWGVGDTVNQKFTGQERDADTALPLDFFQARYLAGVQGRFLSVDDPFAGSDPGDPQSWNLYSYVQDNPLVNTDPDGHSCIQTNNGPADDGDGQGCAQAGVGAGNPFDSSTLNQGQINSQVTGQVPYDLGEQAFVGFYNLFFNGQAGGTVDLALGLLELHPANIAYSAAAHLCSACGTAALAVGVIRGSRGGIASVLKGKLGVQKAIAEIEAAGGTVLGTEVKIRTSLGTVRADVVYQDAAGDLVIGEAKNGPTATFNDNQIFHGYPSGGPISGTVVGQAGGINLPAGTSLNNVPVVTYKY